MDNFKKILELEEKLTSLRKEVDSLYLEDNESFIVKSRIDSLQNEINLLQKDLNVYKGFKGISNNFESANLKEKEPLRKEPLRKEALSNTHKKLNFEQFLGKNLMGVIASILIFISFIFFSVLVLPYLGENAKMILMFITSFVFLFIGMFGLKKNSDNKLFLSLTGCGVGAIFISLFVANIYFKAIREIPLFFALLLWLCLTFYLSKYKSVLFQIIGNVGLFILVIFSLFMSFPNYNYPLLISLFILIAEVGFIFTFMRDNSNFSVVFEVISINFITFIFFIVTTIKLKFVDIDSFTFKNFYFIVLFVIWGISFILPFIKKYIKDSSFVLLNIINLIMGICLGKNILNYNAFVLFLVINIVSLFFVNNDNRPLKTRKIVSFIYLILWGIGISFASKIESSYINIIVVLLSFIVSGVLFYIGRTKKEFKEYSTGLLFEIILLNLFGACVVEKDALFSISYILLLLIIFSFISFDILRNKLEEESRIKSIYYVLSFLVLFSVCKNLNLIFDSSNIAIYIFFSLALLLQIFYKKILFINDSLILKTSLSINACCMGTLLTLTLSGKYSLLFLIPMSIAFFSLNVFNLLRSFGHKSAIYISIKYTLLLITTLYSLDSISSLYSIGFLIFAIIAIVIGFRNSIKEFRIYGLILSLFSIVKLILIDISYDNPILRALSFFVCGILCFVISFIYNKLEKKYFDKTN